MVVKYRDRVLALAVEMWRPLGFCSALLRLPEDGRDIWALGFGYTVLRAQSPPFWWYGSAAGDLRVRLKVQRGFRGEGSRRTPAG